MSNIQEELQQILSARYGKDVRQNIHDAIHTCYEDGRAGAIDLVAREEIDEINEKGVGVEITKAEYDALTDEQKANGDYYITDYPDEFANAVNIPIDAISEMSANNVQNALVELMDGGKVNRLTANTAFSEVPKRKGIFINYFNVEDGSAIGYPFSKGMHIRFAYNNSSYILDIAYDTANYRMYQYRVSGSWYKITTNGVLSNHSSLIAQTPTTTDTTYAIADGESLSTYSFITIEIRNSGANNVTLNAITIPRARFKSANANTRRYVLQFMLNGTTEFNVGVYYKSDTEINIYANQNYVDYGGKVVVYGVSG